VSEDRGSVRVPYMNPGFSGRFLSFQVDSECFQVDSGSPEQAQDFRYQKKNVLTLCSDPRVGPVACGESIGGPGGDNCDPTIFR